MKDLLINTWIISISNFGRRSWLAKNKISSVDIKSIFSLFQEGNYFKKKHQLKSWCFFNLKTILFADQNLQYLYCSIADFSSWAKNGNGACIK